MLAIATTHACGILGGDDCSLWLPEEDGRHLRCVAELAPDERAGTVIDLERQPNNRRGVETKRTMYLTLPETADEETLWFERLGIWGSINAPLVTQGGCLGMLRVNFREPGHQVSAEDLDLGTLISTQAAVALDRAGASAEQQALVARLRELTEELVASSLHHRKLAEDATRQAHQFAALLTGMGIGAGQGQQVFFRPAQGLAYSATGLATANPSASQRRAPSKVRLPGFHQRRR